MASTKITRTSATSSEKKLTISTWLKRSYIGEEALIGNTSDGANWAMFYFDGQNRLQFASYVGSSYVMRYTTNRTFSDVGAWYHLVATVDVSLASPEVKVYVNGEEQTSLAYNITPSQNADIGWFNAWDFEIGVMFGSSYYINGCLSDLYYIQGYIYPASTFGETDSATGEWKPKTDLTINYGGNGGNSCHLKFENSANMDLDSGSNNISFSTSGTLTQTEDCPSNVFATLNPLDFPQSNATFANGNLTWSTTTASQYFWTRSTLGASSGKYYFEAKLSSASSYNLIGITDTSPASATTSLEDGAYNWGYKNSDGYIYNNGSGSSYGSTFTTGDIISVALDLDNNKLYFRKNNDAWNNSGDPTSGATGTGAISITAPASTSTGNYFFCVSDNSSSNNVTWQSNFGNGYFGTTEVASAGSNASGVGIFEYDVPAGYAGLSTKGLNL